MLLLSFIRRVSIVTPGGMVTIGRVVVFVVLALGWLAEGDGFECMIEHAFEC
jgi:hypothetical protein